VVVAVALLWPVLLSVPTPPLLLLLPPPSVRPASETSVQTWPTQLPVQQSLSELQMLPRPASAVVATQLLQSAEMLHPSGQAMSPQLLAALDPVLLQEAAATPAKIERRAMRTELRMGDLETRGVFDAGEP
jgi:hypothetical protein